MQKPNIPASLKNINLKRALRRTGVYELQAKNKAAKEKLKPVAKKMLKKTIPPQPTEKPHSVQFTDEVVLAYWEKQIHMVEVIEDKFEKKVEQFIVKIGDGFLRNLDTEVGSKKQFAEFLKKDFFSDNEDDYIVQAGLDFNPLLENIAILAGNEANKLINVSDPYLLFNYRKQIADNVAKFTQSLLDTDRDHLTTLITNGISEGKSIPEIRGLIEADFSQYSKMQATRITRTEVLRASNQAALDAYKQSGVVEGKQWLTAGAIDECAQYEGKIESLDGSFYADTTEFADGDPPLHPNCRCVLLPVLI